MPRAMGVYYYVASMPVFCLTGDLSQALVRRGAADGPGGGGVVWAQYLWDEFCLWLILVSSGLPLLVPLFLSPYSTVPSLKQKKGRNGRYRQQTGERRDRWWSEGEVRIKRIDRDEVNGGGRDTEEAGTLCLCCQPLHFHFLC
jgi:hypothetical protein